MTLNATTFTVLTCASPGDAARLASLLAAGSAWAAGVMPDQVFDNGSQVELTWWTASVAASSPLAAAKTAAPSTAVAITHKTGGVTTSQKAL